MSLISLVVFGPQQDTLIWKKLNNILSCNKCGNIKKVENIIDCSICLTNKSTIITICNHQYCINCINKWLLLKDNCPYCRRELCNDDIFKIEKFIFGNREFSVYVYSVLNNLFSKIHKLVFMYKWF